jgi:hypothetical protein
MRDGELGSALVHPHYFGFSVPEAAIGAFLYIRYQPASPLSQGGVCVFQGNDNIELTDIAFHDYEITMPWPTVDGNTITTTTACRSSSSSPAGRPRVGAARTVMWHNSLTALAHIHDADWQALGLDFLDTDANGGGVHAQIATWRESFTWAAEGEPNPTIEHALEWLSDNVPARPTPKVLNWGRSGRQHLW